MEQELQALQQELHLSKGRLREQDATIENMRNEEHVCLLVYYMHAFLLSEASTPLVKSLHLQCSERIWCCRLFPLLRHAMRNSMSLMPGATTPSPTTAARQPLPV